MTSAGAELQRAIRDAVTGFGIAVDVEELVSRPWTSITFAGEYNRLTLRIEGERPDTVDTLLDGLAEREFALRGHIIVDIAVVGDVRDGDAVRLTLEALTVEES